MRHNLFGAQTGDKVQEANAYCNLAFCHEQKGNWQKAAELNLMELRIFESIGELPSAIRSLWDLARRTRHLAEYFLHAILA